MNSIDFRIKGNNYELKINKKLSLWVSGGDRSDLFQRNIGSGATFTSALKRGVTVGNPGDAQGAHPLAYEFLQCFLPEYKHWDDLEIQSAMWKEKGEFIKVIRKTKEQADATGRYYFLIVRQNYWPILLFTPSVAMNDFAKRFRIYHRLWRGQVFGCLFDEFVVRVNADEFQRCVKIKLERRT
jgi:hypothetical protein